MHSFIRVVALALGLVGAAGSAMFTSDEDTQAYYARLCGSPQYAYETGYNSALRREPMNTAWVDQYCHPDWRPAIRESWMNGYHAGASNAPAVAVQSTPAASSAAIACRFSSDCGGDGYSCRSWQGTHVCMGFGSRGAPCWFASDCLSDRCNLSTKTCQ
jgi:hypothetical protein